MKPDNAIEAVAEGIYSRYARGATDWGMLHDSMKRVYQKDAEAALKALEEYRHVNLGEVEWHDGVLVVVEYSPEMGCYYATVMFESLEAAQSLEVGRSVAVGFEGRVKE